MEDGANSSCVLLDAMKQLLLMPNGKDDGANDLVALSASSANRSKRLRKKMEGSAEEVQVQSEPTVAVAKVVSPIKEHTSVSFLFHTPSEVEVRENKLRYPLADLKVILKTGRFHSTQVEESVALLKKHLSETDTLHVVVSADDAPEVMCRLERIKYYSKAKNDTIVSFELTPVDGSELPGVLRCCKVLGELKL